MNDRNVELEQKDYASCHSINLNNYNVKNFKTKSFLIYTIEYRDNVLYAKKPFRKISFSIHSVQYFAVSISYKNDRIHIIIITNNLCVIYDSSRKIGCDYLILNFLKNKIPQITSNSAYETIKKYKLKKFYMC